MAKTLQEILALCQEKEIQMIDFKMTDIDGRWRHLSIPVGRLNEDTMQYGIGFDGSNYGYAPIERSDSLCARLGHRGSGPLWGGPHADHDRGCDDH